MLKSINIHARVDSDCSIQNAEKLHSKCRKIARVMQKNNRYNVEKQH